MAKFNRIKCLEIPRRCTFVSDSQDLAPVLHELHSMGISALELVNVRSAWVSYWGDSISECYTSTHLATHLVDLVEVATYAGLANSDLIYDDSRDLMTEGESAHWDWLMDLAERLG